MDRTAAEPPEDVTAFLFRSGLVRPGSPVRFTPLSGGVASDIWKVEAGAGPFAVKRALAKLRVAADWRAPVSRNASEVGWLRVAAATVPGSAPRVLAHDPDVGAFAMAFLNPADHPVWKAELRAGRADAAFAASVGRTIAAIHDATAGDAALADRFANDDLFHALRLEPYLEATAARHRDLSQPLLDLSVSTLRTRHALVHGDVSPKNILVGPGGPVLLDAECAWYGDPAFDVAFCLNHLLLKALWTPSAREGFDRAFRALAGAYFGAVGHAPPDGIERRTARLLPALMLARIDGKSPVEYVTEESDRDRVRGFARPLVASPVDRLDAIADLWRRELE